MKQVIKIRLIGEMAMVNNKVKISLIGICVLIILIIFARNVSYRINNSSEPILDPAIKQTEDDTITRAYAAKLISLLKYSRAELETLEYTIDFEDVNDTVWYNDYVNGLQGMNAIKVFVKSGQSFEPEKEVTIKECKELLLLFDKGFAENKSKDSLAFLEEKEEQEITFSQFIKAYEYLIEHVFSKENSKLTSSLQIKELYVVGTEHNIEGIDEFTTVTDMGKFRNEGLSMEEYTDEAVYTYVRDEEILYVKSIIEGEKILSNVWIVGQEDTTLHVYIYGVERSFTMNNPVKEKIENNVADVVINHQKVKTINIKPDKIRGKVLIAKEDYIEIEGYGKIPVDENYRVYKIYDELMMEMTNAILVGYENTDFVVSDGKICAALITGQIKAQNIRVILRDSNYKTLYHKEVKFTSDKEFTVSYGKKKKKYAANEQVVIKANSELLKSGRVRITTKGEGGKITILSLKRKGQNPSYRGSIEVASTDSGLTIINELPLEEYLYAVIPSEMPTSYGKEALKVQAICARSYAYNHLVANNFSKYGAHVDDSTTYQVYNNTPENKESIQAVKETYGQVLQYDGKVIYAYYFSTSCGYTADVNNVWQGNSDSPYLQAVFQGEDKSYKRDYSDEKAFYKFITSTSDDTYEKDYPWYRWKVTIDYNDLKKMVDNKLGTLYKKKPSNVLTLSKNGTYKKVPINTVGKIKNIKVSKRESSGLATELIIEGSKNTVKVKSESFIRQLLRPTYDDVVRQDDSKISNLSLLPSAFFVIDKVKDGSTVTGIKLSGGGYGHGVGMSQNGVKELVEAGKTYEEILKHYYTNIDIACIY